MKFERFLVATAGLCRVLGGVHGHEHGHQHEEKQIPLHEQEYIQDSAEELERKWSFEVSCFSTFFVVQRVLYHSNTLVWHHTLMTRKICDGKATLWILYTRLHTFIVLNDENRADQLSSGVILESTPLLILST